MTCFLVVFWFKNFAFLEQVEYPCIVGFEHEEPGLCVCCFLSWKTGKKNPVCMLISWFEYHAVFFSCENDVGICMLFF